MTDWPEIHLKWRKPSMLHRIAGNNQQQLNEPVVNIFPTGRLITFQGPVEVPRSESEQGFRVPESWLKTLERMLTESHRDQQLRRQLALGSDNASGRDRSLQD